MLKLPVSSGNSSESFFSGKSFALLWEVLASVAWNHVWASQAKQTKIDVINYLKPWKASLGPGLSCHRCRDMRRSSCRGRGCGQCKGLDSWWKSWILGALIVFKVFKKSSESAAFLLSNCVFLYRMVSDVENNIVILCKRTINVEAT